MANNYQTTWRRAGYTCWKQLDTTTHEPYNIEPTLVTVRAAAATRDEDPDDAVSQWIQGYHRGEGEDAFWQGTPLDGCLYPPDEDRAIGWRYGHNEQRTIIEEEAVSNFAANRPVERNPYSGWQGEIWLTKFQSEGQPYHMEGLEAAHINHNDQRTDETDLPAIRNPHTGNRSRFWNEGYNSFQPQ